MEDKICQHWWKSRKTLSGMQEYLLHVLKRNKENHTVFSHIWSYVSWLRFQYGKLCVYLTFQKVKSLMGTSIMSHRMTKQTKWPVHLAKTQISLGICPVWSEDSQSAWRNLEYLSYPLSTQQRLWSDWVDGCPGWSESWLGTQVIMLVLSCCGSFIVYSDSLK